MTKAKNEGKTVKLMYPEDMIHLPLTPYSGSRSENFSLLLANQVINTLWMSKDDPEEADRIMVAALNGMMGVKPQDEIEGMLAGQMVATHSAAMRCLRSLKNAEMIPQQDSNGNLANKLLRTYAMQLEALQRYRGKGQQKMTVEHVTVNAGGQAIVGNVTHPKGGGVQTKTEEQPHAITHTPMPEMPSPHKERKTMPVPRNA